MTKDRWDELYRLVEELSPREAGDMICKALEESGVPYVKDRIPEERTDQKTVVNEINLFDEEEFHFDCTVHILRNSVTGHVSVGWWDNDNPPATM